MNGYEFRPSYADNPWIGLISQGIDAARDVARGATSNYPYTSPDDPYGNRPINVGVYPQPQPQPQQQQQQQQVSGAQPGGLTLSTNTLMLLVGGVLLFMIGKRR